MEAWFMVLVSLSIAAILKAFIKILFFTKDQTGNLPPSPSTIPIISNILWVFKSLTILEPMLNSLHAKLGPIITLNIAFRRIIFVSDRSIAHQALVRNGAVFASRPPSLSTTKIVNSQQRTINTSLYGPTWRLLRRNLTSQILHPTRLRGFSQARKLVIQILVDRLVSESKSGEPVLVMKHFQFAMFRLLALMCFGDELNEKQIKEVEVVQRRHALKMFRYNVFDIWPSLTKILLRKRWHEMLSIRRDQEAVLIPLIKARKKANKEIHINKVEEDEDYVLSYVDTLFDLELPEEKRKLDEGEMVSLCSEFLNGGTDTTSTALQWIMANLVKYPHIQEKLYREIKEVVAAKGDVDVVKDDDLQRMPYLKAVVLEGLRRHPPGHFVLPHAVTEDVMLDQYLIPKNSTINFMVAEMGWDPKVWEDPMEFKPERFMSSDGEVVFDITGNKEIKMMPFGVGRRICPGFGLAMLHLEYFVANLVWNLEWKAKDGDVVDLSEKQDLTIVMKTPLQAHVSPRLTSYKRRRTRQEERESTEAAVRERRNFSSCKRPHTYRFGCLFQATGHDFHRYYLFQTSI